MIHKPIHIQNLSLSFPHKTCFEDFTPTVNYGEHIAIIGRNGAGKSTLLKMLQESKPDDVKFGHVPQIVEEFESLSGGQCFNKALGQVLSQAPNVLLLDEPTNHLDQSSRKNLMRLLNNFPGTLIIVSHDTELLRACIDNVWHIENGKIYIFSGNYDDYIREIRTKRAGIERELSILERQKKDVHNNLMREQKRAAKSKTKGAKNIEQRKWPTVTSPTKAGRASETSGLKRAAIEHKKYDLAEQLSELRLPEIIGPKFSLSANDIGDRILVSIREGRIKYEAGIDKNSPCNNVVSSSSNFTLHDINLSLFSKARLAIIGANGSGKSTLVKAILGEANLVKSGEWYVPKQEDIGYLDQHYKNLYPEKSVLGSISQLVPSWSHAEIRKHLCDFLFRKNEEVNAPVKQLSGGEKARLSLAQIAAKTPKLLILDEITNNLDLETRDHVIRVLNSYPGTMIVISHDKNFLEKIGISEVVDVQKFKA